MHAFGVRQMSVKNMILLKWQLTGAFICETLRKFRKSRKETEYVHCKLT